MHCCGCHARGRGMQRDGQDQSTGDTLRGASRIREYNTYRICQSSGPSVIVVATCEDVVSLPKRRASFPMGVQPRAMVACGRQYNSVHRGRYPYMLSAQRAMSRTTTLAYRARESRQAWLSR